MKITLLGTGNPAPSLKRMGSGYKVAIGSDVRPLSRAMNASTCAVCGVGVPSRLEGIPTTMVARPSSS